MELQLPLCLEAWSGLTLSKTRYHQPATNHSGRKTLRTPLLDAEIRVSQVKKAQVKVAIMRAMPVAPRFSALGAL